VLPYGVVNVIIIIIIIIIIIFYYILFQRVGTSAMKQIK